MPTKAFAPGVLKRLVHSTVADVNRQGEVGIQAVEGIVDHDVVAAVDWAAFTGLDTLGGDEVTLGQGQGHEVAVVWACEAVGDPDALAVLPNRLQATVQAFLATRPAAVKTTVPRVCIDRWEGYAGAVAAALPAAEGVVDRFPVAVPYCQAVDALHQPEGRRLNADRSADQALPTAKLRSLLRRECSPLNRAQQDQVVNRFQQCLTLASASRLSMTLTALFDGSPDRVTAQPRLQRWGARVTAAGITCFAKVLTTLQHWQDGILKYFNSRHPSGFVDGLNNTLKLLTRRCVGLDDPINLFQRFWVEIEGARQW